MSPFHIDMIVTMHEEQRRRLSRRRFDTDARTGRPVRRKSRI